MQGNRQKWFRKRKVEQFIASQRHGGHVWRSRFCRQTLQNILSFSFKKNTGEKRRSVATKHRKGFVKDYFTCFHCGIISLLIWSFFVFRRLRCSRDLSENKSLPLHFSFWKQLALTPPLLVLKSDHLSISLPCIFCVFLNISFCDFYERFCHYPEQRLRKSLSIFYLFIYTKAQYLMLSVSGFRERGVPSEKQDTMHEPKRQRKDEVT